VLLHEVDFNEGVWSASWIQQPVLQDNVTGHNQLKHRMPICNYNSPKGLWPYMLEIVNQMEHLVCVLRASIAPIRERQHLEHQHDLT
jgi:hypothetical protein